MKLNLANINRSACIKIIDIYFLKDAGHYDLGQVAILVTSQGFWLYAFGIDEQLIMEGKYKTLAGAKFNFFRVCIRDKEVVNIKDLSWLRVLREFAKKALMGECHDDSH